MNVNPKDAALLASYFVTKVSISAFGRSKQYTRKVVLMWIAVPNADKISLCEASDGLLNKLTRLLLAHL
jgi:hypothetical protein